MDDMLSDDMCRLMRGGSPTNVNHCIKVLFSFNSKSHRALLTSFGHARFEYFSFFSSITRLNEFLLGLLN